MRRDPLSITLKTNDGETLVCLEQRGRPLPDFYKWNGRTFKRFIGPENYYIEVEGSREWRQASNAS